MSKPLFPTCFEIDLKKANKHDHPDIEAGPYYSGGRRGPSGSDGGSWVHY